jgi:hypothetical protein
MNRRVFRLCFRIGAWGGVAACGGATHLSGGGDADTPDAAISDTDSEAAACFIDTSNYGQSCSVDSDCVGMVNAPQGRLQVQSGNYCKPMCICGGEAINRQSIAQYVTDVSKTPLGSGSIPNPDCFCPLGAAACCQNGLCADGCYGSLDDAGVTGATGGQDSGAAGGVLCGLKTGPLDSGADASGASRWCMPPEVCIPYNTGWACCTQQSSGGISICVTIGSDGG